MSEAKILENDPLSDSEKILREDFYGRSTGAPVSPMSDAITKPNAVPMIVKPQSAASNESPAKETNKGKPTHYKVVCISLYTQDIENLEATVAELKRRGHTKANKSQLIRQALRQLDIDKLPPPQQ